MFSFGAESRVCVSGCSTLARFRPSFNIVHDLFSRLSIRTHSIHSQNERKKIQFAMRFSSAISSLLPSIASLHLEFAYTKSYWLKRNEQRKKKSNTFCPYLIILHRTPHETRSTCECVRVCDVFLFAQNSLACGAFLLLSAVRFDSVGSIVLFNEVDLFVIFFVFFSIIFTRRTYAMTLLRGKNF